jgi:formylglycine-generating enzyme required for sulfatase activity
VTSDIEGLSIAGYTLEEKIARGRTGTVWRARDSEGKQVALRLFGGRLEPLAPKALERVEQVYKRLEQVMHASVPKVLDQGKEDERSYVVLKEVTGERLDRMLDEQRLPLEQVLALGKTIADGLAAAHTVGLVHTDVCARSVVVTGATPPCALLGWSAARPLGQQLGRDVPRASVRPPDGEAAEALATAHLDVYGLGALLYEALCYAPPRPWDASAPASLRHAWPLRRLNPTVPPLVEAVVLKAIDPDPRARYATAADFSLDLAALIDKRTPRARPAPIARALLRASRRRPALFAGLALALSVGVGLGAATLATGRARSRRAARHVEALDLALAKGDMPQAETELEQAREEQPAGPAVLEAASRLEAARVESDRRRGEEERTRVRDRAMAEAQVALDRARGLRDGVPALEEAVRRAAALVHPLDAPEGPEKQAFHAARAALEANARDEARALGEAVFALRRALAADPDAASVRASLAKVELERCRALDVPRDLERSLRAFAQGAATALDGTAAPARLELSVTPAGATATVAVGGASPRELKLDAAAEVAAGDAIVTLEAPGCQRDEVLVHLEPGRTSRLKVRLAPPTAESGVIVVPGIELELGAPPLPFPGMDAAHASSALAHVAAPIVALDPALVDARPVSCVDYAAFVREKGVALPRGAEADPWPTLEALERDGTKAVTYVSLEDARAYARWKGKRLPTRGELWAARARGATGEVREWTSGAQGALVLDVRVPGDEREPVGAERVVPAQARERDLGFRLAEAVR